MEATLAEVLQSRPPATREETRPLGTVDHEATRRAALLEKFHGQIGKRYASCRFETFEATTDAQVKALAQVRIAARRADTSRGGGLLLVGPPGTGKDHLAAAAAGYAIVKHGLGVEWVNGIEWFGRNRDRIESGDSESSAIAKLSYPDILIISDPLPPDASLSSYQAQMLYQVIDRRYRNLRATWATVNCRDKADLAKRLTGPIADRLHDGSVLVSCWWKSYRTLCTEAEA